MSHSAFQLLVAVLLVLSTSAAFATQLVPSEVSLDEVVQRSNLIVLAVPDTPEVVNEKVALPARDGGAAPPPFSRPVYRFVVKAVLHQATGDVVAPADYAPGAHLEVDAAEVETLFEAHRSYYVDGVGESPIIESYRPKKAPSAERILFLTALKPPKPVGRPLSLRFTVAGAVERPELRKQVEKLWKKAHPR